MIFDLSPCYCNLVAISRREQRTSANMLHAMRTRRDHTALPIFTSYSDLSRFDNAAHEAENTDLYTIIVYVLTHNMSLF